MKQILEKYVGKQQYLYIALAIIGMCFAGASIVFAHEEVPGMEHHRSPERRAALEERKAEIKQKIDERQTIIETRIAERRAILSEKVQERVKMLAGNVTERFMRVTDRLGSFIDLIAAHAETLKADGADTAAAEALLADAHDKLDEAVARIEALPTEVEYSVSGENPRSDWTMAKEEFREIHALIKEVRELLRQAVAALKGAAGTQD